MEVRLSFHRMIKNYGIKTFVQMGTGTAISRKMAEAKKPNMLKDIRNLLLFKSTRFCGVCIVSFEWEALSETVPIEANSKSYGIFNFFFRVL